MIQYNLNGSLLNIIAKATYCMCGIMPLYTAERLCRFITVYQRQQEAKTKGLPSANRSKENEAKELVDRIGELELQCKFQDEDVAIADAAHTTAAEVMPRRSCLCTPFTLSTLCHTRCLNCVQAGLPTQPSFSCVPIVRITQLQAIGSLRTERASLEQRLEAAGSNLEQSTREIADMQEDMQTAECAWSGECIAHSGRTVAPGMRYCVYTGNGRGTHRNCTKLSGQRRIPFFT